MREVSGVSGVDDQRVWTRIQVTGTSRSTRMQLPQRAGRGVTAPVRAIRLISTSCAAAVLAVKNAAPMNRSRTGGDTSPFASQETRD